LLVGGAAPVVGVLRDSVGRACGAAVWHVSGRFTVAAGVAPLTACAVYTLADQADAATDSTASDTVAWGKFVFGVPFLLLAARNWRHRPAPGTQPEMPKWMAGIDALKPAKALGLGLLLTGVNPKNLMLAAAAGAGQQFVAKALRDQAIEHVLRAFRVLSERSGRQPRRRSPSPPRDRPARSLGEASCPCVGKEHDRCDGIVETRHSPE
jgi:hypothetical protein